MFILTHSAINIAGTAVGDQKVYTKGEFILKISHGKLFEKTLNGGN